MDKRRRECNVTRQAKETQNKEELKQAEEVNAACKEATAKLYKLKKNISNTTEGRNK